MIYSYPPFGALGIAPIYLDIDIPTILHHAGYLIPRQSERPPAPRPSTGGRPALSQYVGVTVHRGRWIAQYGPRGKVKTKTYEFTPEGERQAAIDRARGLGLDYLERRDGTREAFDAAE